MDIKAVDNYKVKFIEDTRAMMNAYHFDSRPFLWVHDEFSQDKNSCKKYYPIEPPKYSLFFANDKKKRDALYGEWIKEQPIAKYQKAVDNVKSENVSNKAHLEDCIRVCFELMDEDSANADKYEQYMQEFRTVLKTHKGV